MALRWSSEGGAFAYQRETPVVRAESRRGSGVRARNEARFRPCSMFTTRISYLSKDFLCVIDSGFSGRGSARAEDLQETPTQSSYITESTLV